MNHATGTWEMATRVDIFGTADRRLCAEIRSLARCVFRRFPLGDGTVNVIIVGNRHIHELNRRFLGRNRPTDVLAFHLASSGLPQHAGAGPRLLGEVYVSRDRARVQARMYRVPLSEELRRLVLHGLLHLAGLSHRAMPRHEAALLAASASRKP